LHGGAEVMREVRTLPAEDGRIVAED
jgi:hypothetical protein